MTDCGSSRKRAAALGVTLEVEVVRHVGAWTAAKVSDAWLERAARSAIGAAPPLRPGSYQVALALTDDKEMRALNRTWRGKDASTNVLSFPAGDAIGEPGFLGDVVLAYETVLKEARVQNIPLEGHAAHLVVHGVLHLLGFDHAGDAQAETMEALERGALAALGIADPYAEIEEVRAEASP